MCDNEILFILIWHCTYIFSLLQLLNAETKKQHVHTYFIVSFIFVKWKTSGSCCIVVYVCTFESRRNSKPFCLVFRTLLQLFILLHYQTPVCMYYVHDIYLQGSLISGVVTSTLTNDLHLEIMTNFQESQFFTFFTPIIYIPHTDSINSLHSLPYYLHSFHQLYTFFTSI